MGQVSARPLPRNEAGLAADLARRHIERWSRSPGSWLTEEFIDDAYDMPGLDPANDFASYDLDGRYVALSAIIHQPPYSEIEVFKFLDPSLSVEEVSAVGRTIIERTSAAAQVYIDRAGPDVDPLFGFAIWPDEPFKDVARGAGFTYLRSSFTMRRDVSVDEAERPLPQGVRLRPVDVDADAATVTQIMTTFEDHHGDQVFSEGQLRHFMTAPGARPDLSRIADDEQGACAAVLCSLFPDGGRVDILGTLRRARGRGIGTTLLHAAFSALAGAGCTVVRLNVDAENTTGALDIYERAGMTRESEIESWMRPARRPA
jgi:ribosomal protein S18 acetylase RimI-like enzyme